MMIPFGPKWSMVASSPFTFVPFCRWFGERNNLISGAQDLLFRGLLTTSASWNLGMKALLMRGITDGCWSPHVIGCNCACSGAEFEWTKRSYSNPWKKIKVGCIAVPAGKLVCKPLGWWGGRIFCPKEVMPAVRKITNMVFYRPYTWSFWGYLLPVEIWGVGMGRPPNPAITQSVENPLDRGKNVWIRVWLHVGAGKYGKGPQECGETLGWPLGAWKDVHNVTLRFVRHGVL